jgi:hypothetical protein
MKNIYHRLITAAGLMLALHACKSDLELVPIEQQTIDQVFDKRDSAGRNAERFLTDIYTRLPTKNNRVGGDYLDAATDDAISSNTTNTSVQQLATGAYTAAGYPDNQWGTFYAGIRQANIVIANIDKVPLKGKLSNGTSFNRVWKAEAKFLRAFFYFELVKRHAGVPLLGDKVYQLNDDVELPRSSFEQCINFIVSECDGIKDSLRTDPYDLVNIERPTKAAALALKSKALLYAASPLFNGGNIESSNPVTGYTSFSADRWVKAEQAAKDVINLNQFSLVNNFNDAFIVQANRERIFAKQGGNNADLESANGPVGYSTAKNDGRTSPTQELVNAFGMANGLDIGDAGSGYNANNPYANRDPRFYATIFYNGAPWLQRPVQTFEGGADKPGGTKQQTRTSYYARKFLGNYENTLNYQNATNHDHILFRYAEIILNCAEARNENLAAPDREVYSYVESIRKRAGLNPFALPLGLTKDAMRTIIQNERRKEFAFEEHRFYDVRRWKLAQTLFNQQLHGLLIYQTGTGTIYQDNPVLQMKFDPKMYLAPIPLNEILKNRSMVQNPGW